MTARRGDESGDAAMFELMRGMRDDITVLRIDVAKIRTKQDRRLGVDSFMRWATPVVVMVMAIITSVALAHTTPAG